jgi:hypothetical protein
LQPVKLSLQSGVSCSDCGVTSADFGCNVSIGGGLDNLKLIVVVLGNQTVYHASQSVGVAIVRGGIEVIVVIAS